MNSLLTFLISATACGVEMVEAATVVLAMVITRGRKPALLGAAAGILVLTLGTIIFAATLQQIPIRAVRLLVGLLALWFGFTWLKKAILRASGRKALRDEGAIFKQQLQSTSQTATVSTQIDRVGFIVSFKAVLLEGFEVLVIVLATGSAHHNMLITSLGAIIALVVVVSAAVALRAPLTKVPENTMKLGVGIMLMTFGTFWTVEGAGLHWPLGDLAILFIIAAYFASSRVLIRVLS